MAQAAKKKRRKSKRRQASEPGNAWGMLLIGLVCGAVLSGLYFGYQENEPGRIGSGLHSLLEEKNEPVTTPTEEEADESIETPPEVSLEFHEMLPKIDEMIEESEIIADAEPVEDRPDRLYVLQVGSYKSDQDAEGMRAKLLLSGFEAVIQRVNIDQKGTYYRVRMGPYKSKRKLQRDQKRLADKGIETRAFRLETPEEQARQTN